MRNVTPAQALRSINELTFDLQRFGDISTWNGSIAASFTSAGNNTITITITSAAEFALFAQNVNNGNNYSGWTITLGTDIDLNNREWTPIAEEYSKRFKGTFDGGGHTISNLKISTYRDGNGLFGCSDGTIKNLTLSGTTIGSGGYIGGIAAYNDNNGKITSCTVTGGFDVVDSVSGNSEYIGGIVGYNYGQVGSCTVNSTFDIEDYIHIGALVGVNQYSGTISKNINTSNVFIGLGDNVDGGTYDGADNVRLVKTSDGIQFVGNNKVLCELRGVKDLTASNLQDNQIALTAANFSGNEISVVSNACGVTFGLSGDCNGKTFIAAGDNTIIINDPNINFNVAGFGTGDKIQLGKDMTAYNIVGIESAGGGTKINLINDNEETSTVTVGGLNVCADNSGWTTDGDISAYVENITEAGAMLIDGQIVYAEVHNQTLCALKGLNIDNSYFDDNTLVLTADSFSGNEISVVSNDGNVTFLLAGFDEDLQPIPLTGKTFIANGGKIIVAAYDVTVDVTKGDNTIEIDLPVIAFNVTGFSAGDTIKLGDEMNDFRIESITAGEYGAEISLGEGYTCIIGGLTVSSGGEIGWTFDTETQTAKFGDTAGGGIVTDYGIGATKSGDGKTLSTANGSDIVKVDGTVKKIFFDRDASTKKSATFTATIVYGDDQVIVLKDIVKKPTKTGTAPIYQTNDVAAATLKIWDTSGGKQALLSATKLKKFFCDDDSDAFTEILQAKTDYLVDISKGNTPENNPFSTQLTFTGNNKS